MSGYSSHHKEKVKKDIKKKIKKKVKKNKSDQKYLASGSPVVKYGSGYGKSAAPVAYAAPPPAHDFHLKGKQLIGLMNTNQQMTSQALEWETKIQKLIGDQEDLTKKKNDMETKYMEQLKAQGKARADLQKAEHEYEMEKRRIENDLEMKAMKHKIRMQRKQAGLSEEDAKKGGKSHAEKMEKLQEQLFAAEEQIKQADQDKRLKEMEHTVRLKNIEAINAQKRNEQQSEYYTQMRAIAQFTNEAEVQSHFEKLKQDLLQQQSAAEKEGQNAEAEQIRTQMTYLQGQYDIALSAFRHQGNMGRFGIPVVPVVKGEALKRRGEGAEPGEQVHFVTPLESSRKSYDSQYASEQQMQAIQDIHGQMKELAHGFGTWGNGTDVKDLVNDVEQAAKYMEGKYNPMEETLNKARGILDQTREQDTRLRDMIIDHADKLREMKQIKIGNREPESREEIATNIANTPSKRLQEWITVMDGIIQTMQKEGSDKQVQLEKQLEEFKALDEQHRVIAQKQESLVALKGSHEQLGKQLTTITQEMEAVNKHIEERQAKLIKLETAVKKGEAELAKLDEANSRKEALMSKYADEDERLKLINQQNEDLQKQLAAQKSKGRALQDTYEKNEHSLQEVTEAVGRYQAKNAKLYDQLQQKRKELDAAETEKLGWETQIVEADDRRQQRMEQIMSLQEDHRKLETTITEHQQTIEDLERRRGELQQQYDTAARRRWEAENYLNELTHRTQDTEAAVESMATEVAGMEARLARANELGTAVHSAGTALAQQLTLVSQQDQAKLRMAAGSIAQVASQLGAAPEFVTGLNQLPPEQIIAWGAENIGNLLGTAVQQVRDLQRGQATLQIQPFDPAAPIRDGLDPVTGRDVAPPPRWEEVE